MLALLTTTKAKEKDMPNVAGKKFAYTAKGKKAAKAAVAKMKKKPMKAKK